MVFFKSIIAFLLAILFSLFSCISNKKVSCLRVDYVLPLFDTEGKIIEKKIFYNFYEDGNVFVYQIPYTFDSLSNDILLFSEKRKETFIFHKDSLYGYTYDNKTPSRNNRRLLVDSLIKRVSLENKRLDALLYLQPDSTYSLLDELVEIYSSQNLEPTTPFPYKITLFYSDSFTRSRETFSRTLDSAKNKKLFKVVIDFPASYIPESKIGVPARRAIYEMKPCSENHCEILKFLEKYNKEHS